MDFDASIEPFWFVSEILMITQSTLIKFHRVINQHLSLSLKGFYCEQIITINVIFNCPHDGQPKFFLQSMHKKKKGTVQKGLRNFFFLNKGVRACVHVCVCVSAIIRTT